MTPEELMDAVLAALRVDLGAEQRLEAFFADPDPSVDEDGAAVPYATLYAGSGTLGSVTLCDSQDVLTWPFQVTAAGGDAVRALRAAARVRARLSGKELMVGTAPNQVRLRLVEDPDFDPGPARKDRDGTPPRWFIPMQYRPQVTAT